ncbi:NAD(P)/FAD-dependent oxidoreductase [Geodermatophilus sabuli]|uniref:3-phenylpropionate/trans-cinnamate dioxygenase ferredoxin reductase subunit n=1 Tax=Geodermatophilus sabuli TaxID=1564158 RepID=A0A285E751_9ACTN|nr:FAD-dependent oxidoreductase [Geodermatophilus sabuli]MBB3082215.1 3-phenylpropionate/trans-cinnamate dioxygenase ferredoxin reductase subunit [Geodermatophilus sabuli]SNX94912.1 3-phenylpropionate/trans-cinnamate dioxygenase ferredoxin reductase subunit [Geodermatophilus sabuli]
MSTSDPFVIIGAGLAGAKAAETLREEGADAPVVLVGAEPERPYERPPLSKGYLLGAAAREEAFVHDEGWYAAHDVELRTGVQATRLDPAGHRVRLDTGEELPYARLLLTTGSAARRLPVPGADLDGVRYLRTLADADRLRADLTGGGRRVVVVGAGWIGMEVAAAARSLGNEVVVVEPQPAPLFGVLGRQLGAVFAQVHRDHGVELFTSSTVRELRGDGGRVTSVVTDGHAGLPADLVVVGVGAAPRTELATAAGLEVDDGVLTDEALRTSAPDVFAAGDVAASFSPFSGRHVRVEHWANALHGGPAAARAMLGQDVVHDRVPYFFTDQYELGMEYSGLASPEDTVVCRGAPEDGAFTAFWTADGRVTAAMTVNVWDLTEQVQELIRSRRAVDPQRLADPGVPLTELVAPAG